MSRDPRNEPWPIVDASAIHDPVFGIAAGTFLIGIAAGFVFGALAASWGLLP